MSGRHGTVRACPGVDGGAPAGPALGRPRVIARRFSRGLHTAMRVFAVDFTSNGVPIALTSDELGFGPDGDDVASSRRGECAAFGAA